MKGLLGAMTPEFDPMASALTPHYRLAVGDATVILNDQLGHGITLTYKHQLRCTNCAAEVRKLYAGGHCYDCFSTLARCDLCVMSPDRCHFHLGTCREPSWGESFCMQPHSVYLANTSGPKIGITRRGREQRRWLDSGATQALRIVSAPTRRAAGMVEAHFKRHMNDRTDWRKLVTGAGTQADLAVLAEQLRAELESFADLQSACLPPRELGDLAWRIDPNITRIRYPVKEYSPARRLILNGENPQICDNLCGVIGQYLLFSQGVFNVSDYNGVGVDIEFGPAFSQSVVNDSAQLSLFD